MITSILIAGAGLLYATAMWMLAEGFEAACEYSMTSSIILNGGLILGVGGVLTWIFW